MATAAGLMGVGKRQALRLLVRRNEAEGGRLLRRVGDKRMPSGIQPSKYLVSLTVFHESMRADDATTRDLESLRLELVLLSRQMHAIRRALAPLQAAYDERNGT